MDDYTDGLRQSYFGEIVAEGFYRQLSLAFPEGHRRTALSLIAEVERATHRRLAPFAAQFDIRLSDDDRDLRIRTRLQSQEPFDWHFFLQKAQREWPAYLNDFENLERLARARGEHGLTFLVDHERALLEFIRLELANPESAEALVPMRRYLADASA